MNENDIWLIDIRKYNNLTIKMDFSKITNLQVYIGTIKSKSKINN